MPVCERCGCKAVVAVEPGEKQTRRRSPYCDSCAAKPATTVMTAYGRCRPHKGPFDYDDNPVDSFTGELYRPGVRLCGYSDCIEVKHIEVLKTKPGRRPKTNAEVVNNLRANGEDPIAYNLIMALVERSKK